MGYDPSGDAAGIVGYLWRVVRPWVIGAAVVGIGILAWRLMR